jgi:hypothetical protein
MVFLSAVGFLGIFLMGTGVTYSLLNLALSGKKTDPFVKDQDPSKKVKSNSLNKSQVITISLLGGIFFILLLTLSRFIVSSEFVIIFWSVMSAYGIYIILKYSKVDQNGLKPAREGDEQPVVSRNPRGKYERELYARVGGIEGSVNGLIDLEETYTPGLSRENLCKNAVERLNRDNQ